MNKTDNTINNGLQPIVEKIYLPVWLKNILYVVGVCVIAAPFLLIKYFQFETLHNNSNIDISFTLFDYIYSINSISIIFILITPVIILDRVQNAKLLYSVGLNFDRFALRDIGITGLLAVISIGIISFFLSTSKLTFNSNLLLISLVVAFSEELLFRGYIFQNIYRKNSSVSTVTISSLLFALTHFIRSNFEIIYFLNIFIAGILFCVMYIKTKSLWCSISFHFVWNIVLNVVDKTNEVEHHFICGIILLFLILIVIKLFKPSYRINRYYLIND
jgi:membrane protease YdiL (CAAX protease family)